MRLKDDAELMNFRWFTFAFIIEDCLNSKLTAFWAFCVAFHVNYMSMALTFHDESVINKYLKLNREMQAFLTQF